STFECQRRVRILFSWKRVVVRVMRSNGQIYRRKMRRTKKREPSREGGGGFPPSSASTSCQTTSETR
ncbi:hypothetical protein PMAYCL1PPCAC_31985, partial [Pristionchus mayeri]